MKNKAPLIAILLCIMAAGVILIAVLPSRTLTPAHPSNVSYSGAAYPKLTWSDPEATTTSIYKDGESQTFTGTIIVSDVVPDVTDPSLVSDPFISYYDSQLTSTGWIEDKDLDADGPASSSRTYKKDNEVVIVSYQSVLKNVQDGSPSTCPCDMQFSVFAGE